MAIILRPCVATRRSASRRDHTLHIEGSRPDVVAGHLDQRVTHDRTTSVEGHAERQDLARATSTVKESVDRIEGAYTLAVGKHDAKRSFGVHVEGQTRVSGTDAIEIRSTTAITFRCGDTTIKMLPDGIEMLAAKFRFHMDGGTFLMKEQKIRLAADTAVLLKSDKVALKGSGSSVELTADAKVNGGSVKLKSDADVDDLDNQTVQPTTISLQDSGWKLGAGRAIRHHERRFGSDRCTGCAGQAAVDLDDSAQVTFPDATELQSA